MKRWRVAAASLAASVALHLALALLPVATGDRPARGAGTLLSATLFAPDRDAAPATPAQPPHPPAGAPIPPRTGDPGARARARDSGPAAPVRMNDDPNQTVRAAAIMDPSPFDLGAEQAFAGRSYHHYGSRALRGPPALPDLRVPWPAQLLAQGAEGLVLVRVFVGRDGALDATQTLCRDMRFESEVHTALGAARFSPGEGYEGPEPVAMLVEFAFLQPQPDEDRRELARRIDALRAACQVKAREILAAAGSA